MPLLNLSITHKILKQTAHPDILRDIERCKEDYFVRNPTECDIAELDDKNIERPKPTRALPERDRVRPSRFTFMVQDDCVSQHDLTTNALRTFRMSSGRLARAVQTLTIDLLVDCSMAQQ